MLLAFTPTAVTTYHNDNQSSGINSTETLLTPSTVNVAQFGKQFSTSVDGQVYAQPLYVPNVTIPSGPQAGVHNIVYVATEHDSLYAIDARGGNVLWKTSFLDTTNSFVNRLGASAIGTMPAGDTGSGDITVEIGVTSTPVISQANGVGSIYVEAKSKQTVGVNADHYVQTLYKVDIQTGAITGSVIIADTRNNGGNYTHRITDTGSGTDPYVVGNGYAGEATVVNGQSRVYFNAMKQQDRPGLMIDHGTLYTAWASHGDNGPYHGWVLAYDPNTLALTGVLCTTPNGGLGGIWQGGSVTTTDAAGNLYFETGNGDFNTNASNFAAGYAGKPKDANYSDSFLKVSKDPTTSPTSQNPNGWGLKVADFFSPFNNASLNGGDTDLGSGGDVILPDAVGSAAHPHLLLGSGKEGKLYLVDRDNMGGFNPSTDNVVQTQGGAISGLLNAPAFLLDNPSPAVGSPSGTVLILMGYGGGAKAFKVSNGAFSTTPTSVTTNDFGYLPGSPSITANGLSNPIMWGINRNTNRVYAYRADNLGVELWDSGQAANNRDQLGSAVKFSVPTVADGQVFAGTSNALVVYGPPVPPTAPPNAPSNLTAAAPFYNQVVLNWQDNSNNEDSFRIERTTNPSDPNSWVEIGTTSANTGTYTDSTVLSSTTYTYRVRAFNSFQNGSFSAYTAVASATTPQAPPIGTGDGLAANYFNDVGAVAGDGHLTPPAVLTRIDPTINFDFGAGSPDPAVPVDHFSARWTGTISAPTAGSYTFRTSSDDGVRLYLDNVLVINDWTDHGPTDDNYTISLAAGSTHTIKMEYYENAGGAVAKLNWTTPTNATFTPVPFLNGGATANYFSDSPATSTHLQGSPVITRVDATVDSNVIWTGGDPDGAGTAVSGANFSARWTGKVQAQFTGTYTFHTISDDGVRLWVNGQLIINDWIDQGATDTYGTINLSGGQKYDIRMEYYEGGSPDFAQLRWAGPGTPDQIIPTTQLYSGVAPATPTGLTAVAASGTQINLSWSDKSAIETGYTVERMDPGGSFVGIASLPPNTTSYMDGSLNPDTTYVYRVKATNFAADSAYSNSVTLKTPIPPNKPINAHATSNTTTSISIAWTDTSNNEDGFRVSRSANGGSFIVLAQLPPNTVTYADTGLTPGTDYEYHVQGYNIAGYNDFTGTQTGTLTTAPTALSAAGGAPGQINLSWTPPAYSGHAGITFNVYRSTTPGGEGATPIATAIPKATFTDTGLSNGTTYYYQVTTVDPGGESARSVEASATTVAGPTVAVAAAAANPKITITDAASGASTSLSVLGADNTGESNLTYAWSVVGTPPASVSFTPNGTNAAKNTVANFTRAGAYTLLVTITNGAGVSTTSQVAVTVQSSIASRAVFYNNSAFDGNNAAANAADDGAIAPDKTALLPGGTATFANYTSYSNGINGVIVDLAGLSNPALTAGDFSFTVGNDNVPGGWTTAPAPTSVLVRAGAGVGGSDRVELIWADHAIQENWLQVTVLADGNTGLAKADVFYFGNAIGETGNSPADAQVDTGDDLGARANLTGFSPALIINPYDFNRDQSVNTQDTLIARSNHSGFNPLKLIAPPAPPAPPVVSSVAPAVQGQAVLSAPPAPAVQSQPVLSPPPAPVVQSSSVISPPPTPTVQISPAVSPLPVAVVQTHPAGSPLPAPVVASRPVVSPPSASVVKTAPPIAAPVKAAVAVSPTKRRHARGSLKSRRSILD